MPERIFWCLSLSDLVRKRDIAATLDNVAATTDNTKTNDLNEICKTTQYFLKLLVTGMGATG